MQWHVVLRRPRYLFMYGVVLPKLERPLCTPGVICLCPLLDDVLIAPSGDPRALGYVEHSLCWLLNRPTLWWSMHELH